MKATDKDYTALLQPVGTKQETLLQIANRKLMSNDWLNGAEFGAKWRQERSYSEEEVLVILHNYRNHFELYRNIQVLPNEFFEWFKQFKNK